MKSKTTFIRQLVIAAVASSLPVLAAYGQDDASVGNDPHPAVDSPYLRPKPKATANPAGQAKLSQKDQTFLSKIAAGGVQEVADAQVAMNQGNESTKKIASRIASERGSNNKELVALAKKKGLGLGTDKIKSRSMGKTNYDKQYLYTTSHDYQEDVRLVQAAAQSSDDKDIKAWAAKTLPMLKSHLALLKGAGK
jgi:putative membrane protein